jgi:hypothetical protein
VSLYDWLLLYLGPILGVLVALLLGLAVLVIILAVRLRRLETSYHALTEGTDGGNLETVLNAHVHDVRQATARAQETDELARRLERASRAHIQRVGFLRFNPFRDAGGDQSFAVALADQDGNGVVISSLHSRDTTRVYGKPLAAWESAYPLTEEEQRAIANAKG